MKPSEQKKTFLENMKTPEKKIDGRRKRSEKTLEQLTAHLISEGLIRPDNISERSACGSILKK